MAAEGFALTHDASFSFLDNKAICAGNKRLFRTYGNQRRFAAYPAELGIQKAQLNYPPAFPPSYMCWISLADNARLKIAISSIRPQKLRMPLTFSRSQ